jgi:hypothetical protein
MTTEWIEKARESGKAVFEEARQDQLNFAAESASAKVMSEFINKFAPPVEGVVSDLREAGFVVDEGECQFFYVEKTPDPQNRYGKVLHTQQEMCRTTYDHYQVYGKQWKVRKFGVGEANRDPHNRDVLAVIRIYPTRNRRTHFAGAEYAVWSGMVDTFGSKRVNIEASALELKGQDKGAETFERVKGSLQEIIGATIVNAQINALKTDQRVK